MTSRQGVTLADDWTETATFRMGSIDKLDVLPLQGDALVQFDVGGTWLPRAGKPLRRGLFQSLPGLGELYPPGPSGVRFKRASAGVAALLDFTAFTL